jgi:hypothetical protein
MRKSSVALSSWARWMLVALMVLCGARAASGTCTAPGPFFHGDWLVYVPCYIEIVGKDRLGNIDPQGQTSIRVVNRVTGAGVPNLTVSLDFGQVTDLRIANPQPEPYLTTACAPSFGRVSSKTDQFGDAKFHIMGWGNIPGDCTPPPTGPASYFGILINGLQVSGGVGYKIWDLDGSGVGGTDLSILLTKIACGTPYFALDYDSSGGPPGGGDLSLWLDRFSAGTSLTNGTAACGYSKAVVEEVAGDPGPLRIAGLNMNSFGRDVAVELTIPSTGGGPISVDAFDVAGRRIRSLFDGALAPGSQTVRWNLADDSGSRVSAGVYFIRVRQGSETDARSLVVVR